jgi:SAM-dependent methyltransferase
VVRRDDTEITVSTNFGEVYRTKSFFHWLSRGTAELFRRMPIVLDRRNRVGDYIQRDSAAVAFACREINELTYDPTFWAVIDRLDFDFRKVADLGCGSGGRLLQLLSRHPGTRGLGIDIARPALESGRRDLDEAGLGDRVDFIEADVLHLRERPEFAEVDLVTCFMMGHDFWPRERCVETLSRLRHVFPAARRLVLGDATRSVGVPDAELPIFALGFELGHSLMDRYIPTVEEWEPVFAEAGWNLLATNRINIAAGEVIFELG